MVQSSCVDPRLAHFATHIFLTSGIPVAMALACWLVYVLRLMLHKRPAISTTEEPDGQLVVHDPNIATDISTDISTDTSRSAIFHQHASAFLVLTYIVAPSCSLTQFRGLQCISLDDKDAYLRVGEWEGD